MSENPSPPHRQTTVRRQIQDLLQDSDLSAHEISAAVGIREKEVPFHLEHLRRSLQKSGQSLEMIPPACRKCGFSFAKRQRLSRPGRCPVCRSESLTEPRYRIR